MSRRALVVTAPDCIPRFRATGHRRGACLVVAQPEELRRSFGALIDLQPVSWTDDGLLCVPDLSPDPTPGWRCPFPTLPAARPPVTAAAPARLIAGWYRRSAVHAAAPAGFLFGELVQADGAGFGPHDHPTSAMCLAALDTPGLPAGEAIDVGCGSGLLTLAWAASGRGPVRGFDADPAAVRHAQASALLMGLPPTLFHQGRIEAFPAGGAAGRVVLANLPPVAHDLLACRIAAPPRAAVLSGFTARERERILKPYRRLGLRSVRALRGGRYECHVLVEGEG